VGGGWTGFVNTTLDDKGAVDDGTGGATFETATDPHDQFLAIQMGSQTRILALPPPGTVSIRAVDNGQTLGEAPVHNGVGIVVVPQLQIFSATVQAVNASGAVTAEVKQCRPESVEDINLWNDPIDPGPSNS